MLFACVLFVILPRSKDKSNATKNEKQGIPSRRITVTKSLSVRSRNSTNALTPQNVAFNNGHNITTHGLKEKRKKKLLKNIKKTEMWLHLAGAAAHLEYVF